MSFCIFDGIEEKSIFIGVGGAGIFFQKSLSRKSQRNHFRETFESQSGKFSRFPDKVSEKKSKFWTLDYPLWTLNLELDPI
jgi:hypothetical protein